MDGLKVSSVINKYKKCPECGSSYKGTDLQFEIKDEVIEISCSCGFVKYVDENNEVSLKRIVEKIDEREITLNQVRVMVGLKPIE